MTTIRAAQQSDADRLLQIYDYYCQHTAISFEVETPSLEEFSARMDRIQRRYPYLVAEQENQIAGYAYAAPFVGRAAYDWSCELTIYLDPCYRKQGLGRRLYETLERELLKMGVRNLYACIGVPEQEDEYLTHNSADFHAHLGFQTVGVFHQCGCKFGRWYHMIWMEKLIGDHSENPPPVKKFEGLSS